MGLESSRTSTAESCVFELLGDLGSVEPSSGLECGTEGVGMASGAHKLVKVRESLRKVCQNPELMPSIYRVESGSMLGVISEYARRTRYTGRKYSS